MIELNVRFQERYKQLDALCKDMFSSRDGVTEYISAMEKTCWQLRRYAYDWDTVYKQLKHIRWLRNQLAHEVGAFESELCTESDLKWLNDFYGSILETKDPLAVVGKVERNLKERQQSESIRTRVNTIKETDNHKVSLWSRIKSKIKKWLSK